MTLSIPAFPDGGEIPVKFAAGSGDATSPAMTWADVPAGTQSFFVHVHDENRAGNKTTEDQVHWVFWNIPATATGLPEGVPRGSQLPDGSYQISASGPVYRGPGAGPGPFHHYAFEVYALDTKLDVKPTDDAYATRVSVMNAIQGHILAKAVYWGLFHRQ
jgi:Raf kinase inhibitor-like YbhB/YbcL family protein